MKWMLQKSRSKFSSKQKYLLILGNDCEDFWFSLLPFLPGAVRYWLSIENNCNMFPFDISSVSFGKPGHNISSEKQQTMKLKTN
jgi:hypothetical protein